MYKPKNDLVCTFLQIKGFYENYKWQGAVSVERQNKAKTLYLGNSQNNWSKITGARIKAYRNRFNLTQSELGEKYNLAKNTISSYERGTYTPPLEFIISLCYDAGISLDEFYGLRPSTYGASREIEELLCAFEKASPEAQKYILVMAQAASKISQKGNDEEQVLTYRVIFSPETYEDIMKGKKTPIEDCIPEDEVTVLFDE